MNVVCPPVPNLVAVWFQSNPTHNPQPSHPSPAPSLQLSLLAPALPVVQSRVALIAASMESANQPTRARRFQGPHRTSYRADAGLLVPETAVISRPVASGPPVPPRHLQRQFLRVGLDCLCMKQSKFGPPCQLPLQAIVLSVSARSSTRMHRSTTLAQDAEICEDQTVVQTQ